MLGYPRDDVFRIYEIPMKERERILEIIGGVLSRIDYIVLAIVYGGFLRNKYFRDIDIGIYVSKPVSRLSDEIRVMNDVEEAVSNELRMHGYDIPVDVRVLNNAPLWFKEEVFKTGRVVFDRGDYYVLYLKAVIEEKEGVEYIKKAVENLQSFQEPF